MASLAVPAATMIIQRADLKPSLIHIGEGVRVAGLFSGFPYVSDSTSNLIANDTSYAVNLPAGSGGLLLAFANCCANRTFTWPAGWTEFFDWESSPGGLDTGLSGAYRVADGSEGASVTATIGVATPGLGMSLRIQNYGGVPEVALGTETSTASPNPPNLIPSWGNRPCLWIAMVRDRSNENNILAAPTNYTGLIQTVQTSGNTSNLGMAFRALAAAAADPAAFTLTASSSFASPLTIAVRGP